MLEVMSTGGIDLMHGDAPADAAGLAERRRHRPGPARVLRILLPAHGAVGRPGRRGADRRPLRVLRARPQRPAPGALRDHASNRSSTIASEIGVWDYQPEDVVRKGRMGPGQMLALDLQTGHAARDRRHRQPAEVAPSRTRRWLQEGRAYLESDLIDASLAAEPMDRDDARQSIARCSTSPSRSATRSSACWRVTRAKRWARWVTTRRWRCCRSTCAISTTTSASSSRR